MALDRMMSEMATCEDDHKLVQWAAAMFQRQKESESIQTPKTKTKKTKNDDQRSADSKVYPLIISELIKTFRDRYCDPNLALAIFDHARHLSWTSYVSGCTTPAYNELMKTLWLCFRDLEGVVNALEEMDVNGVERDAKTKELVRSITMDSPPDSRWDLFQRMERLAGVEWAGPSAPRKSFSPRSTDRPQRSVVFR